MTDVIIWGTGALARQLMTDETDAYCVVAYTDNDETKWNTVWNGRKVLSPRECLQQARKQSWTVVIAIGDIFAVAEIANQLAGQGIYYAGVLRDMSCMTHAPVTWDEICIIDIQNMPILPYVEANIIDRCNLNCMACTHFSNLFFDDKETESLEEFQRDLAQVSEHAHILRFRILGGEPLLSPHLAEYVKIARRYLPDTDLRIVTNGLLIPKQAASLWKTVKDMDLTIDITPYQPTLQIKNQIIHCMEQHEIPYCFMPAAGEFLRMLRDQENSSAENAFRHCMASRCRFLRHGKIYTCPMEGLIYKYIAYFGINDFPLPYQDFGWNIYDTELDWNKISASTPCKLCSYCDETGGESFQWKNSKHPEKMDWISRCNLE